MDNQNIEKILSNALQRKGLINKDDTALLFHNLDFIYQRVETLKLLFPNNTLHAIAVKAMPLPSVLRKLAIIETGLEVASFPELLLAINSGANPENIVFDSPVKTGQEIEFALNKGIHINADSLFELERIASFSKEINMRSVVGLRINPQAGTGTIEILSVAGEYSKFGIPVKMYREEIIQAYLQHEWLTGIHVHVGSQGCALPLLLKGIKTVYELAIEINQLLLVNNKPNRIRFFDIGGGLPIAYHPNENPPSMEEYARKLKEEMPGLFNGTFRLITEFGRWIHANAGFTVSRIEYVKPHHKVPFQNETISKTPEMPAMKEATLMIHVGADLLIRECYLPHQWSHEISMADSEGNIKTEGELSKYTLAGPLCFQGDIIARNVLLPSANPGDFIIIHDTGAYTLSQWSRYNSRQMPKVIGFRDNGEHFEILKDREKPEELVDFWS